jgi:S-adenosylmethionine/arginine decarboxylase-like enzyme
MMKALGGNMRYRALSAIAEMSPEGINSRLSNLGGYHFEPQGYTALWLLTESHFAIHMFPEFGKSYIEIASCNLEYYQNFLKLTKEV